MTPNTWRVAVVGAAALALVGCSSPKTSHITPAPATKTSTAAAQSPESPALQSGDEASGTRLDGEACVAITGANLDLSAAANAQDARTAANTLEKYEP